MLPRPAASCSLFPLPSETWMTFRPICWEHCLVQISSDARTAEWQDSSTVSFVTEISSDNSTPASVISDWLHWCQLDRAMSLFPKDNTSSTTTQTWAIKRDANFSGNLLNKSRKHSSKISSNTAHWKFWVVTEKEPHLHINPTNSTNCTA
jgi:hypothetical protein